MSPLQKHKIPPIIDFLLRVDVLVVLDGVTNIRTASFGPGDPNDGFLGPLANRWRSISLGDRVTR